MQQYRLVTLLGLGAMLLLPQVLLVWPQTTRRLDVRIIHRIYKPGVLTHVLRPLPLLLASRTLRRVDDLVRCGGDSTLPLMLETCEHRRFTLVHVMCRFRAMPNSRGRNTLPFAVVL